MLHKKHHAPKYLNRLPLVRHQSTTDCAIPLSGRLRLYDVECAKPLATVRCLQITKKLSKAGILERV